jgi:hypothetical protein
VCYVFILYFGLQFSLVASESYFGLSMMCYLGCCYVILCGVCIPIGIGVGAYM